VGGWSYKIDLFLSITAFQERLAIATNASLLGLLLTKEKKNSDVVFQLKFIYQDCLVLFSKM